MATPVQLDFIGMCLVIQEAGPTSPVTVGFLKDAEHVQLMVFTDEAGMSTSALLASEVTVDGSEDLDTTTIVNAHRLPDIPALAGEHPDRTRVWGAIRSSIRLPHGEFEAMTPVNAAAEGPWVVDAGRDLWLTDRCRFRCDAVDGTIRLRAETDVWQTLYPPAGRQSPAARADVIRATVLSVDRKLAIAKGVLGAGDSLLEFRLLFSCTSNKDGLIPTYKTPKPPGQAALLGHPGNPICPVGRVLL